MKFASVFSRKRTAPSENSGHSNRNSLSAAGIAGVAGLVLVASTGLASIVGTESPLLSTLHEAKYMYEASRGDVPTVRPGTQQRFEIRTSDGLDRNYVVSVPESYNVDDPLPTPVLFAFHGWKGQAGDFTDGSFFETSAPEEAIVVMPGGYDKAWAGAPYAKTTVQQDINYVMSLLDIMRDEFNVDDDRVYALGISNGGGMVANLACQRANVFAAIGMVAAAYYTPVKAACSNDPVPVITVHGTEDDTIPYSGGERHNVHISPVLEETATYARRNDCFFPTGLGLDLLVGDYLQVAGCASQTKHIQIEGGSHSWPEDPRVNQEIWNFLSANSK